MNNQDELDYEPCHAQTYYHNTTELVYSVNIPNPVREM